MDFGFFQKMRSIENHECFCGFNKSHDDLHFSQPISFDNWSATPLDAPKILFNFRVLTRILPLHISPKGSHVLMYTLGRAFWTSFDSSIRAHLWQVRLILLNVSHLWPGKEYEDWFMAVTRIISIISSGATTQNLETSLPLGDSISDSKYGFSWLTLYLVLRIWPADTRVGF